jgi:hypothetical protein
MNTATCILRHRMLLKRSQSSNSSKKERKKNQQKTLRPIFGRNVKRSNQLELFSKQHLEK